MKHDVHSLQKISSPDKIGYVGMLVVVNLQIGNITQRAKSRGFWGNPRGLWLLVEGIHTGIWVVSEMRIHVEIQGKFLNRG